MGITSYGVNPYASPPKETAPPADYSGGGGYGGGGGGYYGGGGGGGAPASKQYGTRETYAGRNIPSWLQEMLVWNI